MIGVKFRAEIAGVRNLFEDSHAVGERSVRNEA